MAANKCLLCLFLYCITLCQGKWSRTGYSVLKSFQGTKDFHVQKVALQTHVPNWSIHMPISDKEEGMERRPKYVWQLPFKEDSWKLPADVFAHITLDLNSARVTPDFLKSCAFWIGLYNFERMGDRYWGQLINTATSLCFRKCVRYWILTKCIIYSNIMMNILPTDRMTMNFIVKTTRVVRMRADTIKNYARKINMLWKGCGHFIYLYLCLCLYLYYYLFIYLFICIKNFI